MEVFFIISLIFFLLLLLHKKYRTFSITCLLGLLLILLIIYPNDSLNAAKEGINLWLFIVVPSLLPFFIINDMLSSLKVPENIGILFSPIAKKLFNTSGYGAYTFIMSIFAGYPSGARIVSTLLDEGKISKMEAEKILTFSSTSGPLFIIGAVGTGMLSSTLAGYILFISHILGAIINGVFSRLLFKGSFSSLGPSSKLGLRKLDEDIISKGIKTSLITCGYIGGYIILFCVIVELIKNINFFDFLTSVLNSLGVLSSTLVSNIIILLESLIEVSNGCKIISISSTPFNTKLILLSFLIAFSGLAVVGQVSGILSKFKLNMKKYIFFKVTHGAFSALICYLFLKINLFTTETISTYKPIEGNLLTSSLLIFLVLILIFNSLGFIINKSK
ncbi:hypothetical protein [Clostridium cylindrosporum]|uniref:Sporulation integral membrane protein YlbJ n=1 Tax=Clostridium cylindrosporum DSM 605 TaxID=1121307 RepID=A0A0J8D5Q8_CLOCY|nr:hypothetical protein [Clostridium cylindrosporum]KMT21470.1 sporulation integral membrane protein YlbJ [Clostridium cylindrosporum DSM 605]